MGKEEAGEGGINGGRETVVENPLKLVHFFLRDSSVLGEVAKLGGVEGDV